MLAYTFMKSSILTENFDTKISFVRLVYFTSEAHISKVYNEMIVKRTEKLGQNTAPRKYTMIYFSISYFIQTINTQKNTLNGKIKDKTLF